MSMDKKTRAKLDELLARLTSANPKVPPTTDFNIGQVPELSAAEKNVRAEEQTNQLFDMITSLKSMSMIESPLAATVVQTLVDALDPDIMKAILFALLGLIEDDQLEDGRRTMVEAARSGALVELFEDVIGEEY